MLLYIEMSDGRVFTANAALFPLSVDVFTVLGLDGTIYEIHAKDVRELKVRCS